jgi:hypothetical protein
LVVGEAGCQGMGRKHFWRTTCRSIWRYGVANAIASRQMKTQYTDILCISERCHGSFASHRDQRRSTQREHYCRIMGFTKTHLNGHQWTIATISCVIFFFWHTGSTKAEPNKYVPNFALE